MTPTDNPALSLLPCYHTCLCGMCEDKYRDLLDMESEGDEL